jgi:Holliday junction DNA helicase RuvB
MEQIKEAREIATWKPAVPKVTLKPLDFAARSANELRPMTFAGMVGQRKLLPLLERLVAASRASGRAMDHMLLLGSAGTGKTTTATVMAHELRRDVYMLKAPVAQEVLEELAKVAKDRDVVFVDEIHLLVAPDRRGISQAPVEMWYGILEDRRLTTNAGVIPFPDVTVIGATTNAGRLPEPLLMRFSLQPRLDPYTTEEMALLAQSNATSLGLAIDPEAALMFARASRGIPRIVNRYCRNSRSLAATRIDVALAREVIVELNATTLDGLTGDMVTMMRFLLHSPRVTRGETVYQASVGSIAMACGKSSDQRIIALAVEPYLIERGFVAIGHGGRFLSAAGIARAREL